MLILYKGGEKGGQFEIPYFAVGFLAVQYLDIPILPLAIFGVVMAFLHLTFTGKISENAKKIDIDEESQVDEKYLLTKKDVTKSYLMWWTFAESTHNYERLLGHSFCMAMTPIIKKLSVHNWNRIGRTWNYCIIKSYRGR